MSHRDTVLQPAERRRRVMLVQTQAENAGAQEISRLLALGLEKRGFDVRQLFFYRRTSSFDNTANVAFCCRERPGRPWAFLKFIRQLYREIRGYQPDVLMTFQHYGNFFGVPAAHLARVPVVIANQNSTPSMMNGLLRFTDWLVGSMGLYHANIVNSHDTERGFDGYPASYRRDIVLVPHGFRNKAVDMPKSEARALYGLPVDVQLLGVVSRLNPLKNIEAPIRALAGLPGVHLAIAGQGEHREHLVATAAEAAVEDRVHFIGEIDSARVGEFLAGLDVFVFPSIAETFGLAGVEAAQAGVPVIANRLAVLEEVLSVGDEPCALFVDATDIDDLRQGIERVLNDPHLANRIASAGRRLEEKYSIDAMVDAYFRIIEELDQGMVRSDNSMSVIKA